MIEQDEILVLAMQLSWQEDKLNRESIEKDQYDHETYWILANGKDVARSVHWRFKFNELEVRLLKRYDSEYCQVARNPRHYRRLNRKYKTRKEITGG